MIDYKDKYTPEERQERSSIMRSKYPSKIPIVVVPAKDIKCKNTQFLVEKDTSFASFLALVRKTYIQDLKSHEAVFCMIGNVLPPTTDLLSALYSRYAESDGILYIDVKKEATFG